jgi:protoporphyrinogen oxidase
MVEEMETETGHWNTVIIGGGLAGLAAGYFLKKMNIQFIILDEILRSVTPGDFTGGLSATSSQSEPRWAEKQKRVLFTADHH